MGSIVAELVARTRFSVKLTLSEADALADAAGQFRGSRELSSAVRRVRKRETGRSGRVTVTRADPAAMATAHALARGGDRRVVVVSATVVLVVNGRRSILEGS